MSKRDSRQCCPVARPLQPPCGKYERLESRQWLDLYIYIFRILGRRLTRCLAFGFGIRCLVWWIHYLALTECKNKVDSENNHHSHLQRYISSAPRLVPFAKHHEFPHETSHPLHAGVHRAGGRQFHAGKNRAAVARHAQRGARAVATKAVAPRQAGHGADFEETATEDEAGLLV